MPTCPWRSTTSSESRGNLATALAHLNKLLSSQPALAEAQAREILSVVPGQPDTLVMLAAALRLQGRNAEALEVLQSLPPALIDTGLVQHETGLNFAAMDRRAEAIVALRRTVTHKPGHASAWRSLGDLYTLAGDSAAADDAYAQHLKASVNDPDLIRAGAALCDNQLPLAEQTLRDFLKANPTDVGAIRMLAEVASRIGRYQDAETLLARAVALAPSFDGARSNYATILHRQNKPAEALAQIEILLKRDPRHPGYRNLEAAVLARLGETDKSIAAYRLVLKDHPNQPKAWMSLGHTLKTAGKQQDAIEAYRTAIAQLPSLGEAWWSLANLKTLRFSDADIAAMQSELGNATLGVEDRFHLHFALGKALEDRADYAASFAHYDEANRLRRTAIDYEADDVTQGVERAKAFFTADFFAAREGQGCPAPDPIFIVGLPRAGSTLLEQILASHSAVEGTMELPDIMAMARRLGGKDGRYPGVLADLTPGDLGALGEEYLDRTRIHRKLGRPLFIDKMPNNFLHTGLIAAILPNAKIIDARRHPLACGFSCFKQHFARGQGFTYSLSDLGRYYADYTRLMAHFDAVLPGRIHRVPYEAMVEDPEATVRALLAYCGLDFEPGCLTFYKNDRIVRTASSEQVRQPIFADAVDHWRHYEPWLGPLKAALGDVAFA